MPSEQPVRHQWGTLVDWSDDRGFGFIAPPGDAPRVFVHVRDFARGQRPVSGCVVAYVEVRDERNRARASEVQYLKSPPTSESGAPGVRRALAAATMFFAVLVGLVVLDQVPLILLAAYALMSAVAFLAYRADKSAAEQGTWRTPESTLHLISLGGGWPGALVARQAFRHKTVKPPFRAVFWATVGANLLVLGLLVLVVF